MYVTLYSTLQLMECLDTMVKKFHRWESFNLWRMTDCKNFNLILSLCDETMPHQHYIEVSTDDLLN